MRGKQTTAGDRESPTRRSSGGARPGAGRPSDFSEATANLICSQLVEGKTLIEICTPASMPNRMTVYRWMAARPEFAAQCARAREAQAEYMDDLILQTATACTPETAQADKVKISAYQWRASKLQPRKYGERIEHVGDAAQPLTFRIVRE